MVKPRRLQLCKPPLSPCEELSDDEYVGSDDACSDDLSDTASAGQGVYDDLDVWQIDDCDTSEKTSEETGVTTSEYFVSVPWGWRAKPASKRYRSMELVEAMLETHREICWLAMCFRASDMEHFREFCKTDWYGKTIISAGEDYSCMFLAMKVAVELFRHPYLVQDWDWQRPVKACGWMNFFAFVRPFRV
ncbi:hypothetical protein PHPALM_30593 [Phytophthora palmivora]|uniref:Uncharacterized protein n=1 Tax=Phytophthora palmivora TaxID=4796 RepID=A0A2P4X4R4_9STRA|nr:hypothetical protein PHPALM_30593 [Phytophthora palmivora]